jgi:branched-chain amino acid transport system substrate-binding protein
MKLSKKLTSAFLMAGLVFSAQASDKKVTPGVTDKEIKIGSTGPKSGPAAAWGILYDTMQAYIKTVNAKGGIKGRTINFELLDDGYNPAKTVEQTKILVERDQVAFIFAALGTAPGMSVIKYLNDAKIPQLFEATGFPGFNDPKNFPWTTPANPTYDVEAIAYGQYILKNLPDAKIAILYQNDGYGTSYLDSLKNTLGDKADKMIVAAESYEVTDPTIKAQMLKLKNTGATVLVTIATPKQATQVLQELVGSDWKPVHIMSNPAALREVVFKAVGLENAKGVITIGVTKDLADPKWNNDADVKEFKAFLKANMPANTDPNNLLVQVGYVYAKSLENILGLAGNDLSRENIMKLASNFHFKAPLMLPGVEFNVKPDDLRAYKSVYLVKFDGKVWVPMGDIIKIVS